MICVRRPHPSIEGRRTSRVWEVGSTTISILALGADLVAAGAQRVVLESTSDYRRSVFYLLEATGLSVWLVNAREVKQVTGRPKTDKLSPQTIHSGVKTKIGKTGKGNRYLKRSARE